MFNKIKSFFFRNSPYDAGNQSRNRKSLVYSNQFAGTEDKITNQSIDLIRKECRTLYRNNAITRSAIDRYTMYSIGSGINPRPQTSDKNWNKLVELWWKNNYVPKADYRGINGLDLIDIQRLIISHRIIDGDCGLILLENGQVLPVEAERIVTPNKYKDSSSCVNGVRIDRNGVVTGYYVCERKNDGSIDKDKFQYYRKEDFILISKSDRIDQIRGIPLLAPVINKIKDYDETDSYVRAKIKLDSLQAYKVTSVDGNEFANAGPRGAKIINQDGSITKVEDQGGLQMHYLANGSDIQAMEGKTPTANYLPYIVSQQKEIAAALGISYEILCLEFANGSYSSQRQALLHNQEAFASVTKWLIKSTMSRLYNWRIALAIKNKEIPAAPIDKYGMSEFSKKTFNMPYKQWVDPTALSQANQINYNMGTDSIKNILDEQSRDRDEVFAEKGGDIKQAILTANEINSQNLGVKVTWRDIIMTTMPGQISPSTENDKKDITPEIDETDDIKDEELQ